MSPRERWIISHANGKTIVDIGFAGQKGIPPAYFSYLKKVRGDGRIIGIDHNYEVVLARGEADSIVGDALCLPIRAGSVNCIVLGEFIEHHSSINKFLQECHRVLNSGGQILITTPNPYFLNRFMKGWLLRVGKKVFQWSNIRASMGHDDHMVLWDPLSLCNLLLRAGFTINEMTSLGVWIPWLSRVMPMFRQGLYLNFWPINRVGYITCICCTKQCAEVVVASGANQGQPTILP